MAYNFLIVDDSSIVRRVIIKTVGMTSIEVNKILEASNGKEALEQLRSAWVDLIFLDINMPIMNGMQFMEELMKDEAIKDTPVVVVSTEGSRERVARLTELGVKAYLRKPVTPESLTETVEAVLSKGRGR